MQTPGINDQLEARKLSSLKADMVSGMWTEQERKKKVEQVKALIQSALFLAHEEERKQQWLETVEEMDLPFLEELSAAIIRENLRFKKGKCDLLAFLQKRKSPSMQSVSPRLGFSRNILQVTLPQIDEAKMDAIFQETADDLAHFDFSQKNSALLDVLFARMTALILHEFLSRKSEYVASRATFLEKLQLGIPTSIETKEDQEVVAILQEARLQQDKNPIAREIAGFWTVSVPALDAVVFPELEGAFASLTPQ